MIHPSNYRRFALALLLFLASVASGSATATVALLPQEQAIANDMVTDPNQGRPYLVLDPIIEAVARARAKDMAVRNYFSHVNPDGVAANYLLRQAGYQLPAWWGTDPTDNYVESIAAGYSSPSDTWTQWMNSPPHKTHLLGQNSFFATETHYGVGYYYDPNSTYQYYWVVITAPPEPVEITTPGPAARVSSTSIGIAGSADPGTNPASVQFRVENTSGIGAYQTAIGLASWSGTASLLPGSNLIRAQSLDASGNVLGQSTCTVNCDIPAGLAVAVSGSGSVTAGYLGATTQETGRSVTIRAFPAPGSVFAGWTGSVVSDSPSVTFAVQDGMSLQANFQPTPFIPVSGAYYGILTTGSGAQAGIFRLSVSTGGIFTGRILIGGSAFSVTGSLDITGSATVTIPDPRQPGDPLTLTLQADLTGASGQITGSLSGSTTGAFGLAVSQSTYNPITNVAPQAGRYTLLLPPNPDTTGTSVPQGNGYAAVVVYPGGAATLAGRLADGTPYSAVGRIANDGTLAIYCVPSGAPAGSSLTGLITFRSTDVSDIDGALTWTKAPQAAALFYPAGFSTQLPAIGSHYSAPTAGLQSMGVSPGAATAGFAAGNLLETLAVPVVVTQSDKAAMATPGLPDVTLAINPVSGTVSGTFIPPGGNLLRAVQGIVFQKQQAAYGYFRGIDQCGSFSLTQ